MNEHEQIILNTRDNLEFTINDGKNKTKQVIKIRNNIFRPLKPGQTYKSRFNHVHKYVKEWIVHRALKVLDIILDKYIIRSIHDIPKEKCNNIQRIFYSSFMYALHDSFKRISWKESLDDKDEKIKILKKQNSRSYKSRKLLLNIAMTEILEDTFDRSVMDLMMIKSYHEIHKLYNGNVPLPEDFLIYDSKNGRDVVYFLNKEKEPLWVDEYNIKNTE